MLETKGKNVLLFGASGDIGNAFLDAISEDYENLVLVFRSKSPHLKEKCSCGIKTIQFNYPDNIHPLETALSSFPAKFDIVINCIGYYKESDNIYSKKDFDDIMMGNFYILQYIMFKLKDLMAAESTFINISSIAANIPNKSEFAYGCAKALVDRFLNALRINGEFPDTHILNIHPGAVVSEMTKHRKNSSNLIDPYELAKFVLNVASFNRSLTVSEIDVYRKP